MASSLETASTNRRAVIIQSLDAQSALLHYALALFAVSLPIFVWVASHARNAAWMAATFAIFAINWGAFYGAVNWIRTHGHEDVGRRLRVHVAGGLLWAAAVAQVAAMGTFAEPVRQSMLMLATAGAIACIFFSAPVLPALLIVGPVAAAVPLTLLLNNHASRDIGVAASGAVALALALGL